MCVASFEHLLFGSVPMDASLDDKRPVLVSQPNGAIAEEFRRIHTNIDFLQTDRTEGVGQLLVITSAQPSGRQDHHGYQHCGGPC